MRSLFRKEFVFSCALMLTFLMLSAQAQPFPPTIEVPVTFYDFHSTYDHQVNNQGCGEFNPQPTIEIVGLKTGMVQERLDSDGKPQAGSTQFFSKYIENWWRSSEDGEQTVTDKWPYYPPQTGIWSRDNDVTENPFANKKILDTLVFRHIGNGMYEFRNTSFFPLDGRGFGNEPTWNFDRTERLTDHNYSFTMSMITEFVYQPNMTFKFSGDDDVWVFIEGRRVLDIGGIHEELTDEFDLDDIGPGLGLVTGRTYTLSFFFAERQADLCHIWITTNMITYNPTKIKIDVEPDDTMYVGDTLIASATIESDTGVVNINDLPGTLTWGYTDLYANNPSSTFTSSSDKATFIPTEAWTTVLIWGHYDDNGNDIHIKDTADIVVLPGPPDRIVIEASPDKPAQGSNELWNQNPLNSVTIGPAGTSNEQFYAIFRDKEQNWIGPAVPIDKWSSNDPGLITAEEGTNPAQGQGRANRATWSRTGTAKVSATRDTLGKTLTDDIDVILQGIKFNVLTATYYETDTRPDGRIDKINVTLDDRLTMSDAVLDALFPNITLPASRNLSFARSDMTVTSDGFAIAVSQPSSTVPNTAVSSTVDILNIKETQVPGVGAISEANIAIADSLGAVINRAVYHPGFNQATRDTLIVTYSENVKQVDANVPFGFKDNSITYSMTLSYANHNNAEMTFIVQSITGKPIPENNDSIWILKSGDITDNANIIQDKDTKPIPMEVLLFPVAITTVAYKETDATADGHIDLITVGLNRDIAIASSVFNSLAGKITLPAGRQFSSLSGSNFTDTDAGFEVRVSQNSQTPKVTSVSSDDKLTVTGNINLSSSYTLHAGSASIKDSIGPVILKGTFYPKSESGNSSIKDTLIVDFSEEVKVPTEHNDPFRFFDKLDSKEYSMELTPFSNSSGQAIAFRVDAIINMKFPRNGDSLWIMGGKKVSDIVSIIQEKNTVRAPLIVKPYPFNVDIRVKNPTRLNNLTINPKLIERYQLNNNEREGTLILIKIPGNLENPKALTGKLNVFDAVGNYVSRDIEGRFNESEATLIIVWDARNQNKRRVGPGPYAGIVTIKYGDIIIERKVLIAVQK